MGGPWRWAALLGFALFAPVTLPAGGSERRQPEVRRRQSGEPLLPASLRGLQAAPERQAPVLTRLSADQPCGCCAVGAAPAVSAGCRWKPPLMPQAPRHVAAGCWPDAMTHPSVALSQ